MCAPSASSRSRPAPSSVPSAAARWSTAVSRSVRASPRARASSATGSDRGGLANVGELLGEQHRALLLAVDIATGGGALLASMRRVLARRVGGLAGGSGGLARAERLRLGAIRLPAGDFELAAVTDDQLAQLV